MQWTHRAQGIRSFEEPCPGQELAEKLFCEERHAGNNLQMKPGVCAGPSHTRTRSVQFVQTSVFVQTCVMRCLLHKVRLVLQSSPVRVQSEVGTADKHTKNKSVIELQLIALRLTCFQGQNHIGCIVSLCPLGRPTDTVTAPKNASRGSAPRVARSLFRQNQVDMPGQANAKHI